MRPTLSLIKREFTAYFYSPIGFVTLAVFLLVTGRLFGVTMNLLTEPGPRGTAIANRRPSGENTNDRLPACLPKV